MRIDLINSKFDESKLGEEDKLKSLNESIEKLRSSTFQISLISKAVSSFVDETITQAQSNISEGDAQGAINVLVNSLNQISEFINTENHRIESEISSYQFGIKLVSEFIQEKEDLRNYFVSFEEKQKEIQAQIESGEEPEKSRRKTGQRPERLKNIRLAKKDLDEEKESKKSKSKKKSKKTSLPSKNNS